MEARKFRMKALAGSVSFYLVVFSLLLHVVEEMRSVLYKVTRLSHACFVLRIQSPPQTPDP